MMNIYKVSYVVIGSEHPGAIVNRDHAPVVGEKVILGDHTFEVIEVLNLMPPRGDFHYIHATIQLARDNVKK
jgi:hypothetical protein